MQEICSSSPVVVTGIRDPNKSRALHHHNLQRPGEHTKKFHKDKETGSIKKGIV